MFQRLRGWFYGRNSGPAPPEPQVERASGEEAWMTRDEEAREATTPGTPRLKWGGGKP
jgi:hypothetical protein